MLSRGQHPGPCGTDVSATLPTTTWGIVGTVPKTTRQSSTRPIRVSWPSVGISGRWHGLWCPTKVPARKHPPFVPKSQFLSPGVLELLNYVNFLNLSFLGHITRKIRLFVLFDAFYTYDSTDTFVRMQGVSYLFPYEGVPFRTAGLLRKGYEYPPFVPLS